MRDGNQSPGLSSLRRYNSRWWKSQGGQETITSRNLDSGQVTGVGAAALGPDRAESRGGGGGCRGSRHGDGHGGRPVAGCRGRGSSSSGGSGDGRRGDDRGHQGGGSGGLRSRSSSSRGRGGGGSCSSRRTGDGGGGRRDGRRALGDAGRTGDQSGARDGVRSERAVDVEENTFVLRGVESGALDAGGGGAPAARHLKVEALRVVLRAVLLAGAVQGDDLVAEDVEAGGDAGRDLDEPGVVVGDQLVRRPGARSVGAVDETDLVDLEELERVLVDRLAAGGATACEIVDDGALVGLGPCVPLNEDAVSGWYDGVALGVGGIPVANDVAGSKGLGTYEAVVGVGRSPAGHDGGVAHIREDVGQEAAIRVTVDDEVGDMAVCGHGSRVGEGGKKRVSRGRQIEMWMYSTFVCWDRLAERMDGQEARGK